MLFEHEGDLLADYEHEIVDLPGVGRGPILRRKPNGDCHYLGADGCTIHDRTPVVCRVFDCRGAYLNFLDHPRNERRRMIAEGYVDKAIFDRGRALLDGKDG
jgi:Fe-S-cluster containining protein